MTTDPTKAGRCTRRSTGAMSLHALIPHSPDDIGGFTP